jgi:ribosome-associated protein YbcJ (S4-like RNA binding protein)
LNGARKRRRRNRISTSDVVDAVDFDEQFGATDIAGKNE